MSQPMLPEADSRYTLAGMEAITAEQMRQSPFVLLRPLMRQDGNAWIALYGENLATGVVGTGESPAKAAADFDRAWYAALPPQPGKETHGRQDA